MFHSDSRNVSLETLEIAVYLPSKILLCPEIRLFVLKSLFHHSYNILLENKNKTSLLYNITTLILKWSGNLFKLKQTFVVLMVIYLMTENCNKLLDTFNYLSTTKQQNSH